MIEAILGGVLWGGHGIAAFDLPFDLSPRVGRPLYLAVFATAGGLGFAITSAVAGVVASVLPPDLDPFGLGWTNLHFLFLASALARALAALFARPIPEPGARRVRDLLRGVWRRG